MPSSLPTITLQTASDLLRSMARREPAAPLATSVDALDHPQGGGFARGTVTEICGKRSSGRFSIALAALAAATTLGEAASLVDLGDAFDPRAAQEAGVELERLLWLRPRSPKEALMAGEMVLATGFGLVILDFGLTAVSLARVREAAWMRLARVAQTQKNVLLVLTPHPVRSASMETIMTIDGTRPWWAGEKNESRFLGGLSLQFHLEKKRGPRITQHGGLAATLHGG